LSLGILLSVSRDVEESNENELMELQNESA
jgi:hypothetical protein